MQRQPEGERAGVVGTRGGETCLREVVVDAWLEGEAEVMTEVVADTHLCADGELPRAFLLLPRAETGTE